MITAATIIDALGDAPLSPDLDCALLRLARVAERRRGLLAGSDAGAVARDIAEAVDGVAAAGTGDPEDDAVLDAVAHSVCGMLRYVTWFGLEEVAINAAVSSLPLAAAAASCGTGSSTPGMVRAAGIIDAANAIASVSELMSPHALAALLAVLDRRVFAMTVVMLGGDRVSTSALIAAITAAVSNGRIAPVEALALVMSTGVAWKVSRVSCGVVALERFASAVVNANSGAATLSWTWAARPRAPAPMTLPPIII